MKWAIFVAIGCLVCTKAQYLGVPYVGNGYQYSYQSPPSRGVVGSNYANQGLQKGGQLDHLILYNDDGEEYYEGDNGEGAHHEESAHGSHAGQKAQFHKDVAHQSGGHYDRDRGYGYEKAYGYDRVKSHHNEAGAENVHSQSQAEEGHHGHNQKAVQQAHKHAKHLQKNHHLGKANIHEGKHLKQHNNNVVFKVHDDGYVHHNPRIAPFVKPVVADEHLMAYGPLGSSDYIY